MAFSAPTPGISCLPTPLMVELPLERTHTQNRLTLALPELAFQFTPRD